MELWIPCHCVIRLAKGQDHPAWIRKNLGNACMLLKRRFHTSKKELTEENTNNVHDAALRWADSFIKAAFAHTAIQDLFVSNSLCENNHLESTFSEMQCAKS